MNQAVVPVKGLGAGKSRLADALDRGAIEALTLAMLGDLLEALGDTPEVDETVVVTRDRAVAAAAEAEGARSLTDVPSGLNPALDAAVVQSSAAGADRLLVVLGDVAGATPADLSKLFARAAQLPVPGALLAPARDGGTAALLRTPPDAVANCFGPDSAKAHREAAERAGVAFAELALPSLAIDLDVPADLRDLADQGSDAAVGGHRTRRLLARLRAGDRRAHANDPPA